MKQHRFFGHVAEFTARISTIILLVVLCSIASASKFNPASAEKPFWEYFQTSELEVYAEFFGGLQAGQFVYRGEAKALDASYPGPSIPGWRVFNPSGTEIANELSPNGWTIQPPNTTPLKITITAPNSAPFGSGYRAESAQFVYGGPYSAFVIFDVVPGSSGSPNAPQNLAAYPQNTKIKLTWTLEPTASSYNVERSLTSGTGFTQIASGVTDPTYLDTGLTNGTTYYYVVKSVSAGGTSGPSNEASATPQPMKYPLGVPTDPPLGYLDDPLALPEWMDHLIPVAYSNGPAGGSSSGTGISLPYGVVIQNDGIDAYAKNPVGSDVAFARTYRSTLAVANLSSPGLPRGWTHNWDYKLISEDEEDWAPIHLVYPNGASDELIPEMQNGVPTGEFQEPNGCGYDLTGVIDTENDGQWLSFTATQNAGVTQQFIRVDDETPYRLKIITEANGATLTLNYLTNHLSSIVSSKVNYTTNTLLSLVYDPTSGLLTQVHDGLPVYFSYDANGQLSGVSSRTNTGNLWSYAYTDIDGSPFLSTVTTIGPLGFNTSSNIDFEAGTGRATKVTDSNGAEKEVEYFVGESREISSQASNIDRWSTTKFDSLGRFTSFKDEDNFVTNVAYDGSYPANITSVSDPDGFPRFYAVYDSHGNQTQATDLIGMETLTTWEYPAEMPFGRPTESRLRDNNGITQDIYSYTYYNSTNSSTGALENAIHTVDVDGQTATFEYTELGNVKKVTGPGANGQTATVLFDYLSSGQSASTEKLGLVKKVTDPLGRITTYGYDAQDRLTSETDPIGRTTTYAYNNYDEVTSVSSLGKTLSFNRNVGAKPLNSVSFNPGSGAFSLSSFNYDNEFSLNSSTTLGQTNSYYKDAQYDLKSLNNGGGVKMHAFEEFPGTRISRYKMGTGAGSTTWETKLRTDGTPELTTSPMSDLTTVYFTDGRLSQLIANNLYYPNVGLVNNLQINRYYDDSNRIESGDQAGTQANVTDYTYDANGYLATDQYAISNLGGQHSNITYDRNDQGLVLTMKVDSYKDTEDLTYHYSYNVLGWVTQITTERGQVIGNGQFIPEMTANYEYDTAGRVIAVRTPLFTTIYEYNNEDQITKILNLSPDGVVQSNVPSQYHVQDPLNSTAHTLYSKYENFTYDPLGNRTGYSYTHRGKVIPQSVSFVTGTVAYSYTMNRLTSETYTRTGHAPISYTHAYTAAGNMTTLRGQTLTYDANSDQLTNSPAYANPAILYDPNGGTRQLNSKEFLFDPIQRLRLIQTAGSSGGSGSGGGDDIELAPGGGGGGVGGSGPTVNHVYTYDHNNLRRSSEEGAPATIRVDYGYAGSSLVWKASTVGSASEIVHYLWGPTGPILEYSASADETLGFLYDPQGSLTSRTSTHPIFALYDDGSTLFDGYGNELFHDFGVGGLNTSKYSEATQIPFLYKGQYGYINDNTTGLIYCWNRYYDPKLGRWISRDPIGLEGGVNTYEYCGGNPVMYIDPDGLTRLIVIGSMNGLEQYKFVSRTYLDIIRDPYDKVIENPTREELMGLLASGKYSDFIFFGHGGLSSGGLQLNDSGSSNWFYPSDLEKVAKARERMGIGKMDTCWLWSCGSVSKGEYINGWLRVSKEVEGYPGWSGNQEKKTLNARVKYRAKQKHGWMPGSERGAPYRKRRG